MRKASNTWVLVLAGGEGRRLRELTTTPSGETIPKQYCSMQRDSCLLEDALKRAEAVALSPHICSVVSAPHRRWWSSALKHLPPENILVEPLNRGTTHGIMLALLQIERRAPSSTVVLLPSDHYFRDEGTLARSLRTAANLAADNEPFIYLLGAEPDRPDPELGYVVPVLRLHDKAAGVMHFIEKPHIQKARELIDRGAMWNTFILAGSVHALLSLFEARFMTTMMQMRQALGRECTQTSSHSALDALYDGLQSSDFYRDVLQHHAFTLQVVRLPNCGWNDLGTPKRVEETVRNLVPRESRITARPERGAPFLDLSLTPRASRLPQAS